MPRQDPPTYMRVPPPESLYQLATALEFSLDTILESLAFVGFCPPILLFTHSCFSPVPERSPFRGTDMIGLLGLGQEPEFTPVLSKMPCKSRKNNPTVGKIAPVLQEIEPK